MTMTLIGTQTLVNDSTLSITFTEIPDTFTDLLLVFSMRINDGGSTVSGSVFANSYLTGTYSRRQFIGNGSSVSSSSVASDTEVFVGSINANGSTANTFSSGQVYIPNYRSSNQKSFSIETVQERNATTASQTLIAYLWNQTAAITSLSLGSYERVQTMMSGTTASLYGITAGSDGIVTTS